MFGAVATYLYEYVLGIKQERDSVGFERISVSPAYTDAIEFASGHITTERGVIAVSYERRGGKTVLKVSVPDGVVASVTTPLGAVVEVSEASNLTFV